MLLLLLFAVQHNVMARPWFKDWWTQFVPRPIERSTYVAAASLILLLLYWQWRPMPEVVWHVDNAVGRGVLWVLYFAGWAIVFYSSFVIDHFELFGLKQVWLHFMGREPATAPFSERSIYRWVRHPLMLGFIVAFWSAPTMSQGRLLFAVVTTAWILIAIQIEERDLAAFLGEPYRGYRERTPMLVPWPWSSAEAMNDKRLSFRRYSECIATMNSATASGTSSSIGSPAAMRRRISVLLMSMQWHFDELRPVVRWT